MSSSISLNPAVNEALSQLGAYVNSKKKATLEKPMLEQLERLTQDEKKLLAESLGNDVQKLNALKKLAKKNDALFQSFVEVMPDFSKVGAKDTAHSNEFVAADGNSRSEKIVGGFTGPMSAAFWQATPTNVTFGGPDGVVLGVTPADAASLAASMASEGERLRKAAGAGGSPADAGVSPPTPEAVAAHAKATVDRLSDPSRNALPQLEARREHHKNAIKELEKSGGDKKAIAGHRMNLGKIEKQIKQLEASTAELGKAEAGLREGGKKAMSFDEAIQLYIDHKIHGKPMSAEQQAEAVELMKTHGAEFRDFVGANAAKLPEDVRAEFDGYMSGAGREKKPSDQRIVSRIQQGMLAKLQETHPDLARGVQDRIRQLEEFNRNSERTHSEIMSLLNSGLPIEVVMMLVMALLTQREEEKFKLKMSEVALAEQFERVREKVEHERNILQPYRERIARGQGIDDLPKLNIPGEKIVDGADIERIYNKQAPSPADFGMSTKSTQVLMQELEVSQQRFNQMMQLLSAVIRQFQDLTSTIIRNIRT